MYYYIKGKYVLKGENFIVIEANGVGYKIFTSTSDLSKVTSSDEILTFYTYFYVREDTQDLYGFITNEELNLFQMLISVSGVGPKAALSIMSSLTINEFTVAIITNDIKTVTKAQGIGPKVAQRIILELKDKVKADDAVVSGNSETVLETNNNISEAITALVVLGYSANEAKKAVEKADCSESVENIIKASLKYLTK